VNESTLVVILMGLAQDVDYLREIPSRHVENLDLCIWACDA